MPKILACTDGSIYANSVYHHTAWAAAQMSADVSVLHMLDPHHEEPVTTDTSGSIGFGAKSALLDEIVSLEAARAKVARKKGEVILEQAREALGKAGVDNVHAEQKHGRLSDSIEHYERDADLVVIGKRGHHANFATGHIGHNLERVIRSCQQPVLVASREFTRMQRFVLAFDGGPSALKAVEYAANNPLLRGMRCHLLSVGQGNPALEAALQQAEQTLRAAGYEVSSEMRDGEPDKVIGEAVIENHFDLLVMGAYGHSQIRYLIVGSTTTTMIRTVHIPVLLFR